MAMALVMLQVVKRVPSRTLLCGAHVILMLHAACQSRLFSNMSIQQADVDTGRASETYRAPTALYRTESPSTTFGVAILPATLWRLVSAMFSSSWLLTRVLVRVVCCVAQW
jgi:hypothetical protein